MPLTAAAIVGGGALLGGYLQGNAAKDAAETSANAQLQSAKIAADAAKFRPVGITNTFGSSSFGFDRNGNLKSAGYTLSPELKAMQDQIMGYTRQGLTDTGQLQALARGYLATTPQEAAAQYIQQQQGLMQPARDVELAKIRQNLFNTGRGGLSVSQGGTLGASNPELQAYYNAIAQQDAQLAAQADQYGRERTNYGVGLLSSAYSPFQTGIGLASTLEDLGQQPFALGLNVGGRSSQAGANAGQSLLAGGMSAAKTMQAANSYSPFGSTISGLSSNPQFTNAFGNWLSNQYNYGGTPQGGYGQQSAYMAQVPYSNTQQAQMLNAQTAGMFD